MAVFDHEHTGFEDLCGQRKHHRQITAGAVADDVGVGADAEVALVGEPCDPRRRGARHDAQLLERVLAVDRREGAAGPNFRVDSGQRLAAEGSVAQQLHQMRVGGEVGAVGMIGGEGQPPRVGHGQKPLQADCPLPGMDQILLLVGERQHTTAPLEMEVVRNQRHARGMGQMLGGGRVARHRHRAPKQHLADVEREVAAGVEELNHRCHARAE